MILRDTKARQAEAADFTKAEHPYRIVKNIFGFLNTVYRGAEQNINRLYALFAGANLHMLVSAGDTLSPV